MYHTARVPVPLVHEVDIRSCRTSTINSTYARMVDVLEAMVGVWEARPGRDCKAVELCRTE